MLQRNYTIRSLPISLVMRIHSSNYIIFKSAFMVSAASLINQILSSLSTDGNSSGFGYQIKPVPMPVFQES